MGNSLIVSKSAGEVATAEKTFDDYVAEWLAYLSGEEQRKKPRTITNYRYSLKVFKDWLTAESIPLPPTKENIKDWCKAMDAAKWENPTKNLYLTTVRNFYAWLKIEYGVPNIAEGIKGWQDTKEHKRGFLSIEEMKQLLAVVEPITQKKLVEAKTKGKTPGQLERIILQGLRDKAILAALMAGGLRTIEISRLRIADLTHDGGACVLNVLGKGRSARETVKISRKAETVIRDWLNAREAVEVVSDDSPLFCSVANNSFGEPITNLSVSRLCKEYLQAAGLKEKEYKREGKKKTKPVTAHSLRGSCATNAFLAGATLDQVKQQLRHRNLATTQIYLEEAEKFKNPVSDLISDGIF